jgi:DNA ligase-1
MGVENVINIFKQLQDTRSLNDKKLIIYKNKNDELFKKFLVFLLDSNITTGISTKKWDKIEVSSTWESDVDEFDKLLDYITKNNSGRDDDVIMCKAWCKNQPEEIQEFAKQIITKKFRLGCDKKVVNSVIPRLIPSWDVQQAFPMSDANMPKKNEWFALSQKLNGNNAGYYKGKLISRQGKAFSGLDHIIEDIQKIPDYDNFFFNGELIRKNIDNLCDNDNFQLGTGIINSDDSDKSCIQFVIYEMIPVEEFEKGESKYKYKDRKQKYLIPLSETILEKELDSLKVVPFVYEGTDISVIEPLLNEANEKGWEGLMLNKNTVWKNKRNNGILKVKSFKHADILCTGVVEGDGKYKGTLGLIKCDYKGYELGVGSGFTDSQRNFFWNNPDEIVGKIVQIKYKGETQNKNGGISVQFPIFEIVRTDKTEPSYN